MSEEQKPILEVVPEKIVAKPAIDQAEKDFLNGKLDKLRRVYFLFSENNATIDIPEVSQRLKVPGGEAAGYCQAMVALGLLQVEKSLVSGAGGGQINRNHFVRAFTSPSTQTAEST